MRLLVCGGRSFKHKELLWSVLSKLQPEVLIHGGAKTGADAFAHEWAQQAFPYRPLRFEEIVDEVTAQEWDMLSGFAGNARNQRMLKHAPDLVLATPGGSGTGDMVQRALDAGLPVLRLAVPVREHEDPH